MYGKLVKDVAFTSILLEKKKEQEFIFYGNSIIRGELRATPKNILEVDRSLRPYLLQTYDSFITKDNHNLPVTLLVEKLGEWYYQEYKKRGGNVGFESMQSDLIIVATASIYQLDIVISNDQRTLLSEAALKAYKYVNEINRFKNPEFIEYSVFREKVIKRSGI